MKVVLISSGVLPVPVKGYGGLEQIVYDLAICLDKQGHEVFVVAPPESEVANEGNIKLLINDPPLPACNSNAHWWEYESYNRYRPLMDSEEFKDAVWHDHSWKKFTYLAKMQNSNLKVCSTLHGMLPYQTPPPIERPCMIGISKSHADQMASGLGIPVKYVYNGIDIDKYFINGNNRNGRFLFLGRITTYKGPHIFIDIMKENGYRGDIVGDDALVEDPAFVDRVLIMCNNYPNVRYWGEMARQRCIEMLQQAKAYISPLLPNWQEPFGLSIIEAMACGTPVIATKNGSIPELIEHGVSGYVVETTHDISKYLTDEALSKITAENCRKQAEKFSRENMCNNYLALYGKVLEGGW